MVIYVCNMYIYNFLYIFLDYSFVICFMYMYICLFFSCGFYFPFDLNEYFGWVLPG